MITDEQAKAAQELAKATSKGLDSADKLGGFFDTILGQGMREIGGGFADWAAVWRYKRAIRLADTVSDIIDERGLRGKTTPIPPRLAIPLLQHASVEDDNKLADMWAAMVANATDPSRAASASRLFIQILSSLEPIDAAVLQLLYDDALENPSRFSCETLEELTAIYDSLGRRNTRWIAENVSSTLGIIQISIENLGRSGLICDFQPELKDESTLFLSNLTTSGADIALTNTGTSLVSLCQR